MAAYKSFIHGVSMGFYDAPDAIDNDKCLDSTAIIAMYNMIEGWEHG